MENTLNDLDIQEEKVGADLGNDSLKVVLGAKHYVTMKNAVSRRMLSEKRKNDLNFESDENEKALNKEIKGFDIIVKKDNVEERFFIGDEAITIGEDETVVGTEKADNQYIHIPLLGVLAYKQPKSKKVVKISLGCGLPVEQYNKENRKKLKNRIVGEYEVTLLDENGDRGRTVTIIITKIKILAEGTTVLINQMFNEDATDIEQPRLAKGQYGVADIGAFTTDIPVIVDGKPDSKKSSGLDEGISTYIDKISQTLSTTTKANITRNQLLSKIINDDIDYLNVRGKKYPLRQEVESQLTLFAKRIVDTIDGMWKQNYEIEEFFIVGGGAIMLKPYIMKYLSAKEFDLSFIEPKNKGDIQNNPQLQNAFGYWKVIMAS